VPGPPRAAEIFDETTTAGDTFGTHSLANASHVRGEPGAVNVDLPERIESGHADDDSSS